MDTKDSFFYRRRLSLYWLIVAFGLVVLCALAESGLGLAPFAWFFPAGVIQSISKQLTPYWALAFGYTVYVCLLIALSRAQTAARAQSLLIVLLIIVIATINGCRKVLGELN